MTNENRVTPRTTQDKKETSFYDLLNDKQRKSWMSFIDSWYPELNITLLPEYLIKKAINTAAKMAEKQVLGLM